MLSARERALAEQRRRADVMASTQGPPTPFDPDWVVPTSWVLREWLEDNGLTPSIAVVAVVGRGHPEVAQLVQDVLDDKPMPDEVGRLLSQITGVSENFWVAFEKNYRVGLAAGKVVVEDDRPPRRRPGVARKRGGGTP